MGCSVPVVTEPVEQINKYLIEHFGIDSDGGGPIWRVVYSEDQLEKRHGTYEDYTTNGLYIRTVTEVREVKKYNQWIHFKYVLERLVIVPDTNIPELPMTKKSYEPIWVFQDKNENALPPKFNACKLIIDTVYAAQYGGAGLEKYKMDPMTTTEGTLAAQEKRVNSYIEELFGDQSSLEGTTKTGESIIVPNSYEKVN